MRAHHLKKMYDQLISFYESLPIARSIYTLVLLAIIFALAGELMSVWRHGKISVSDFSYYSNGKKNQDYAEQLRSETIANYQMIVELINANRFKIEQDVRNFEKGCSPTHTPWYRRVISFVGKRDDQTLKDETNECTKTNPNNFDSRTIDTLMNSVRIQRVNEIAKTLDITVQGVSLKGLFSTASKLVTPPQTEIVASVYESENKKRAYISVASDSTSDSKHQVAPGPLSIASLDSSGPDPLDAFRLACYLIWLQISSETNDTDHSAISFEEFNEWAKLLVIKNALETTDPYRLEARKKLLDIDFVKQKVSLAAGLKIGFQEVYASLPGFEKFIGAETIKLGAQADANIDSVADLIRYFAVTRAVAGDRLKKEWIKYLPTSTTSRELINKTYFGTQISTRENPDKGIDDDILTATQNIVRITRIVTNRRTNATRQIHTTGLIVNDDLVLTVVPGIQTENQINRYFVSTTVQFFGEGGLGKTFSVRSASFALPEGKSPFVVLSVPGLKRKIENPEREFNGPRTGRNLSGFVVAGFIRNTSLTFADRVAVRQSDTSLSDNDTIHFLSGKFVADYDSDYIEDGARRVYLSAPFSPGLTGSPIYDEFGRLVSFVEAGFAIGKNLSLTIAVSIAPLKSYAPLKNREDR